MEDVGVCVVFMLPKFFPLQSNRMEFRKTPKNRENGKHMISFVHSGTPSVFNHAMVAAAVFAEGSPATINSKYGAEPCDTLSSIYLSVLL